jgi:cytochrome c oxidase subunit 2
MCQSGFQDPASPSMEGIYLFNMHVLFIIIGIVLLVGWLLCVSLYNFLEVSQTNIEDFTHADTIEIVWTSLPSLILFSLSFPSFSLLYSLDEIAFPQLTFKIFGHQWYWSYELSDFKVCGNQVLKYSCYIMPDSHIEENYARMGLLRNLETDRRILLPAGVHLRLLITAVDVLHSWTVPSFGVKVDACPGRLNQANLFVKRVGIFFGQCSEICGVNHGFMPIAVLAVPSDKFHYMVFQQNESPIAESVLLGTSTSEPVAEESTVVKKSSTAKAIDDLEHLRGEVDPENRYPECSVFMIIRILALNEEFNCDPRIPEGDACRTQGSLEVCRRVKILMDNQLKDQTSKNGEK